jgi:2-hydroxychromene-2-carboxylate isomerase
MPVTVDYYMTLNSPWTYLGSALFAEIAKRNDATVNIKPCKFGPIFEQTGGLPLPKRSPQRRGLPDDGVETLARRARHSGDA